MNRQWVVYSGGIEPLRHGDAKVSRREMGRLNYSLFLRVSSSVPACSITTISKGAQGRSKFPQIFAVLCVLASDYGDFGTPKETPGTDCSSGDSSSFLPLSETFASPRLRG